MIEEQDGSRPDFWTYGGRAALLVVLVLFGFRAALLNTGLGDVVEFLAGIAIGVAVIAASLFIVRVCDSALRQVPNAALALFVAALFAVAFFNQFAPASGIRRISKSKASLQIE